MRHLITILLIYISVSCSEQYETIISNTDTKLPSPSMGKNLEAGDYKFTTQKSNHDSTGYNKTITKTITINNIKYQIALNTKGDTIYMATSDPRLITEEGYKVGTKWSEIDKKYQHKLKKEMNFGYTVQLDSKWQLGFCEGEGCINIPIYDTSKVDWIFYKR